MEHSASRRALLGALLAALPTAAFAQGSFLDQGKSLLNNVPGAGGSKPGGGSSSGGSTGAGTSLSQSDIGAGLKDALKVASQRVVGRVGKTDGYWGDSSIRIPLPGPVEKVGSALKAVGAGGMLDDLQLKMNRAAEQAAPKALNIFVDACSKMSINDARSILTGPNDAATQYFKKTSTGELTTAFAPWSTARYRRSARGEEFQQRQNPSLVDPLAGQEIGGFNLD